MLIILPIACRPVQTQCIDFPYYGPQCVKKQERKLKQMPINDISDQYMWPIMPTKWTKRIMSFHPMVMCHVNGKQQKRHVIQFRFKTEVGILFAGSLIIFSLYFWPIRDQRASLVLITVLASFAPSHYLNQRLLFVVWLSDKIRWQLNKNKPIMTLNHEFEKFVFKMSVIWPCPHRTFSRHPAATINGMTTFLLASA